LGRSPDEALQCSRLQTYNLAWGGATVDAALAKPYTQSVHSLTDQVKKDFFPHLPGLQVPAAPDAVLGVDRHQRRARHAANESAVNEIFGRALPSVLDALVTRGGAKFIMLMDVPPLEVAPDVVKTQAYWRTKVTAA